jgi:hypothetical protein
MSQPFGPAEDFAKVFDPFVRVDADVGKYYTDIDALHMFVDWYANYGEVDVPESIEFWRPSGIEIDFPEDTGIAELDAYNTAYKGSAQDLLKWTQDQISARFDEYTGNGNFTKSIQLAFIDHLIKNHERYIFTEATAIIVRQYKNAKPWFLYESFSHFLVQLACTIKSA